jgi:hypothetical protein
MLTDIRLAYAALLAQLVARVLLGPTDEWPWIGDVEHLLTRKAVQWVFILTALAVVCGTAVLVAFYRHTVVVIANRSPVWAWRPLWTYFMITKPLEMMFRFATAPLRCLPEVCIIGEVRCGTTTLARHLQSMPGARGPFCGFHHPLDGKESFYFAGHYFGFVHPYFYRAMFPLRFERWWHTAVLGRPFLVFDGCAQYLTSPFAAQLLRASVGPELSLLVCLREPVAQNVSWWKFEQASIAWFDSMGIPRSLNGIGHARMPGYPPATMGDALALSRSAEVEKLYEEAEALPNTLPQLWWIAPQRYITWPNGQLSALAKNGCYAANIQRWQKWFGNDRFVYFELGEYTDNGTEEVVRKLHAATPASYRALARDDVGGPVRELHENQAPPTVPGGTTNPTQRELDTAAAYYDEHNKQLFALLGREWPDWRRKPRNPK